ncbi:MAG: PAS domain S-box protein [Gemmatimonadaceae bacterium]
MARDSKSASAGRRRDSDRRLGVQYEVSRVLARAERLDEAAPQLMRAVCEGLDWDLGQFWVAEPARDRLCFLAAWRAPTIDEVAAAGLRHGGEFARGTGLPGHVWATCKAAWVTDLTRDAAFPLLHEATRAGIRSAFAFPVTTDHDVLGVLEFMSREVREPDDDLLRAVTALGNQIGQFIERRSTERRLNEREALHRAVVETALDAIVAMDAEGRITEFNPAAERIFGYTREQAVGRNMAELIIPPRYRTAHEEGLKRYLATGEARILGKRVELPAVRADGTEFPAELAITVVPGQRRPAFVGYMRDITDRKRAEEERARLLASERDARGQAEAASRAKSEFLAAMSHELRTPLNAIGGYAELLELGVRGPITSEQREDLTRLRRSQQHLLAMINDVLNFAKIDAGHVNYEITDVRAAEVLADVEAIVTPLIRERGLRYVNRAAGRRYAMLADRDKVLQILLNLLTNAVKYTEPGGSITVDGGVEDDAILIRVNDTGIGIPGDRLPRIFDPFVQVNRRFSRPLEGVGLGLAISRDLARGMNGDLTVVSAVGKGSTFTLALPRVARGEGRGGRGEGTGIPAAPRAARSGARGAD